MWEHIAPLVPPIGTPGRGTPSADHRAVIAGLVCAELLGTAWVKIPATLGVSRRTCRTRLDRWEATGTWAQIRTLVEDSDHFHTLTREAITTAVTGHATS
ncbi:transposase [Streptomyces sp. NPDC059994]|uniref:transposase n=1 Tax=Streptomyces sp. NPDC059994 TaxID=3347029 RepID=UPI0036A90AE7